MDEHQKILLFANEPIFYKQHLQKIDERNFFSSKQFQSIYPSVPNIERFKNLEQSRYRVIEDERINKKILDLVIHLHRNIDEANPRNEKLQEVKKEMIKKFQMDYLHKQLDSDLDKLSESIEKYSQIQDNLVKDRLEVTKIIKMTEIKKALALQNRILKGENAKLKEEERELDELLRKN